MWSRRHVLQSRSRAGENRKKCVCERPGMDLGKYIGKVVRLLNLTVCSLSANTEGYEGTHENITICGQSNGAELCCQPHLSHHEFRRQFVR